eukprot:s759_g17.t1
MGEDEKAYGNHQVAMAEANGKPSDCHMHVQPLAIRSSDSESVHISSSAMFFILETIPLVMGFVIVIMGFQIRSLHEKIQHLHQGLNETDESDEDEMNESDELTEFLPMRMCTTSAAMGNY